MADEASVRANMQQAAGADGAAGSGLGAGVGASVPDSGRMRAIGRMLQAQPTAPVLRAFLALCPEFGLVTLAEAGGGTAGFNAACPGAAVRELAAGKSEAVTLGPEQLGEIEQDYLRLFVGLGTPLAPPWESAWASDARLLFQRQTLDVRYWYRSAGLQIARLHHEPDDHIGLELEFAGLLIARGDARTAAAFAQEHPLAWVDRWAAAVQGHARNPFYPALARAAAELLHGFEKY